MQLQIEGRASASQLPGLLREWAVNRVFLVTGRGSYSGCGAQAVFDTLLAPFEVTQFSDFSPNIDIEDARAGAELCSSFGAQGIVAVGGGSALDMAKCIAAFAHMPGCEHALVEGATELTAGALPIIAVPTTGGTGSEATHFAVVYIEGKKYSLASPHLLPAASVLDPGFTDQLPPYITACCGFDALCQAVESFWSVGATPESRGYAGQAIPMILSSLPQAVNRPGAADRDAMMLAANLAGKAINITKTTAPHALSYTITSRWGVPHGHAVALSLGAFFPYHDPASGALISAAVSPGDYRADFDALLALIGVADAQSAKARWYELMAGCGLRCALGEQQVESSGAIDEIVAGVNLQRLANHPVVLEPGQLKDILRSVPWEQAPHD